MLLCIDANVTSLHLSPNSAPQSSSRMERRTDYITRFQLALSHTRHCRYYCLARPMFYDLETSLHHVLPLLATTFEFGDGHDTTHYATDRYFQLRLSRLVQQRTL